MEVDEYMRYLRDRATTVDEDDRHFDHNRWWYRNLRVFQFVLGFVPFTTLICYFHYHPDDVSAFSRYFRTITTISGSASNGVAQAIFVVLALLLFPLMVFSFNCLVIEKFYAKTMTMWYDILGMICFAGAVAIFGNKISNYANLENKDDASLRIYSVLIACTVMFSIQIVFFVIFIYQGIGHRIQKKTPENNADNIRLDDGSNLLQL